MVVSVASVGSASGAAAYYANDNYYTVDQSAEHSEWGGDGAARLELSGKIDAEVFEQVLSGKLPNGVTISGGAGEHVAGMDLTFSAPKSVSLVGLIGKDERVVAAHVRAVRTTMAWAEKNLAYARRGANGRETLATGNLVYALFPHDVSRAHDPQLHVHVVIANATQRPDGAWRALRNTELYKQNTLIGAIYNAELRASLEKLGYAVEVTGKHGSFEIAGIERATIEQWSTRHGQIVALAKDLGIATPEGLHAIAERTRDAKTEMTRGELIGHWDRLANERGLDLSPMIAAAREASPQRNVFERVRDWGKALLDRVTQAFGPKPEPLMRDAEPAPRGAALAAAYAVSAGVRHLTERQATFQPYELLRAALNFGSHGARIDGIEARVEALVAKGVLLGRNVDGVAHMTTRDVLRTERELVERTMDGRGIATPLVPKEAATVDLAEAAGAQGIALSDEQARAALAVLSGQNRYQLVQGDAGSGKTTLFALLREVAVKHGHEIVALTPQHRLAGELRAEAGLAVDTVASFLARHQRATGNGAPDAVAKAARDIGGKIVLIDEASMLSSRQMLGIMQIADNAGAARLILVGDSQQISSPEAGRPFALLQEQGAPAALLSENRRQCDPAMREAVAAARLGNIQRALDVLGDKVSESARPAQSGAAAWLALSPEDRARTAIFTSGHALRAEVLDQVRAGLIGEGALGDTAIRLRTFENLNFTHEQMRQLSSYAPGQRLDVFQRQSRAGLERGRYGVSRIDLKTREVELKRGDKIHWLKPESLTTKGKGLALSTPTEIEVRAGDRLIWTTNNRELGITNGNPVDVLRIDRSGITLRDAAATRTLAPDNPLRERLAHGLVLNMHRAQGLTVDRAITVMDSHDRMLNSKSLFYVLSSRAREHLGLHIDSKSGLAEAVGKHRGDVPHAQDVGRDVRSPKGAERDSSNETPPLDKDKSPELAIQIELGIGRPRAFEIGL